MMKKLMMMLLLTACSQNEIAPIDVMCIQNQGEKEYSARQVKGYNYDNKPVPHDELIASMQSDLALEHGGQWQCIAKNKK